MTSSTRDLELRQDAEELWRQLFASPYPTDPELELLEAFVRRWMAIAVEEQQGPRCTCQIDAHDFNCPKHGEAAARAPQEREG